MLGGLLSKAWAAEGAGARLRRGSSPLRVGRSWDPELHLALPRNLPTAGVLALLSSQDQDFSSGLACRWAQNDSKDVGTLFLPPAPFGITRPGSTLHFGLVWRAGFAKPSLQGDAMLVSAVGSGVPQAGPHLPTTPARREDELVRTKTSDGGSGSVPSIMCARLVCTGRKSSPCSGPPSSALLFLSPSL